MPAPSLSQQMQNCFTQLSEAERKSLLAMVKTFLNNRKQPQSLDDYNKELEQADAEIEAGDYVTHEDALNRFLKKKP